MRMLPHFDIELKKYVHSSSFELIYESSGIFDYSKINDAMEDLKQKLILQNLDKPSCKRLFGIVVESLENAYRHSVEQTDQLDQKVNLLIYLLKYGKNFKLIVGNFVDKDECIDLQKRFNKILELEKHEIQELCMERMKQGIINKKGGGGLGMLDIALRSEGNVIFKTFPASEKNDLFLLEALVKASKTKPKF